MGPNEKYFSAPDQMSISQQEPPYTMLPPSKRIRTRPQAEPSSTTRMSPPAKRTGTPGPKALIISRNEDPSRSSEADTSDPLPWTAERWHPCVCYIISFDILLASVLFATYLANAKCILSHGGASGKFDFLKGSQGTSEKLSTARTQGHNLLTRGAGERHNVDDMIIEYNNKTHE